jgi:hypothetical protein
MADGGNAKPPPISSNEAINQVADNASLLGENTSVSSQPSREGTPPPLPPRPRNVQHLLSSDRPPTNAGLRIQNASTRPSLQAKASTAVSLTNIQTLKDGSQEVPTSTSTRRLAPTLRFGRSRSGSEAEDSASIRTFAPTIVDAGEMESIIGEITPKQDPGWKELGQYFDIAGKQDALFPEDPDFARDFEHEFDELDEIGSDSLNEGQAMDVLYSPTSIANLFDFRCCHNAMEIEIKAFLNSLIRWKTNLFTAW